MELDRGLEWELSFNFSNLKLKDPFEEKHSAQMAKEVIRRLRDMEGPLESRLRNSPASHSDQYGDLADEVRVLYSKLEI